jgi:hypothetical protein
MSAEGQANGSASKSMAEMRNCGNPAKPLLRPHGEPDPCFNGGACKTNLITIQYPDFSGHFARWVNLQTVGIIAVMFGAQACRAEVLPTFHLDNILLAPKTMKQYRFMTHLFDELEQDVLI